MSVRSRSSRAAFAAASGSAAATRLNGGCGVAARGGDAAELTPREPLLDEVSGQARLPQSAAGGAEGVDEPVVLRGLERCEQRVVSGLEERAAVRHRLCEGTARPRTPPPEPQPVRNRRGKGKTAKTSSAISLSSTW